MDGAAGGEGIVPKFEQTIWGCGCVTLAEAGGQGRSRDP